MKQTTNGLYLYEAADSPDLVQGYNKSMEKIDPVLAQGGGEWKHAFVKARFIASADIFIKEPDNWIGDSLFDDPYYCSIISSIKNKLELSSSQQDILSRIDVMEISRGTTGYLPQSSSIIAINTHDIENLVMSVTSFLIPNSYSTSNYAWGFSAVEINSNTAGSAERFTSYSNTPLGYMDISHSLENEFVGIAPVVSASGVILKQYNIQSNLDIWYQLK